jgi:hypothetical protein
MSPRRARVSRPFLNAVTKPWWHGKFDTLVHIHAVQARLALGARPSNVERAPSRRATRASIFKLWLFFVGEADLLGACSRFSDTLLAERTQRTRRRVCDNHHAGANIRF